MSNRGGPGALDRRTWLQLQHVYVKFGCAAGFTAAAAYTHYLTNFNERIGSIGSWGALVLCIMLLLSEDPDGTLEYVRFMYLVAVAVFMGLAMKRMLEEDNTQNLQIYMTVVILAVISCFFAFLCFSYAAFIVSENERRALLLKVDSIIFTLILILVGGWVVNALLRIHFVTMLLLLVAIVICSLSILSHNHHNILEYAKGSGNKDVVSPALHLLLDVYLLFIVLVKLMTKVVGAPPEEPPQLRPPPPVNVRSSRHVRFD